MNIAILTMSLNIGGAETHIYELSCALADKGHNVTVFSAGGVYAQKLIDKGINHIEAPLTKKDPKSLIKAYKVIDEYVKNNRPCVIHSHTRISNFTADKLSKKYNIPFVSTIHGHFSTGTLQKIFSKWGTRALAVSEDLKDYAYDNYGMSKDKVSITVNGINLNTFCKSPMPEIRKELGISEGSKVILCVSRLNDTAANHVFKVFSLSEEIFKSNPDTNIVVIGGGDKYDELYKLSEQINSKTKSGFIKLLGPQTDIYKYCNIADLFIGISRSALEAMACKVPTILLGNTGYIGLVSNKTLSSCIETNFTCRSCPYPTDNEIANLIKDMLSNPDKYKENVEMAYDIVKNRYSVNKMAEDAIEAYEKAYKDIRPYDIMVCGYYGRNNLGDDVLLKAITDNLKTRYKIDKTVLLTADPSNNPFGIDKCIHRFNLFQIKKHMKKTRAFILGGGSILQDATSSRSLYYYLYITRLAQKYGCGTMLYSNGIGPIHRKHHRKNTTKLLKKINCITTRDSKSTEYLQKLGVENKNIYTTADEVFAMKFDWIKGSTLDTSKRYLCLNLRNVDHTSSFISNISYAIDKFCQSTGITPILLPLHFDQDTPTLKKISNNLTCEYISFDKPLAHSQTLDILKKCEFVVSERLHGMIFSAIFGLPFIAINYDPKVVSLCEELDVKEYMIESDISGDEIYHLLEKLYQSKEDIKQGLESKVLSKRNLAKNNAIYAKTILD